MNQVEPVFDSARKALVFALNHSVPIARPLMNKMAADGALQRLTVKGDSGEEKSSTLINGVPMGARLGPPPSSQLRGLDGAATAAMVLTHLSKLSEPSRLVLVASCSPSTTPCSCRAPCCRGYVPNRTWSRAVDGLCEHLKTEAQLSKIKGKKGLSTSPELRRALVEKFILPKRRLVLSELAEKLDISEQTVISHRRPIIDYLGRAEDEGWRTFGAALDESGIVGLIL